MEKIPCLFERIFHGKGSFTLTDKVTPGCEWVLAGDCIPYRKWDGSACMIKAGQLYKRYDCKRGQIPPVGAIPCQDHDLVTGHWPHWVLVGDEPASKYHREAYVAPIGEVPPFRIAVADAPDGTYELCGPKVNGNHEGLLDHQLIKHDSKEVCGDGYLISYERIREFLADEEIEGIVFWHWPDKYVDEVKMCKIRRHDFGFEWPIKGVA